MSGSALTFLISGIVSGIILIGVSYILARLNPFKMFFSRLLLPGVCLIGSAIITIRFYSNNETLSQGGGTYLYFVIPLGVAALIAFIICLIIKPTGHSETGQRKLHDKSS
ncbi:hypothetical protein [Priestia filamentosa]|uniref:Uncharacterized protein n=1 Tax=Priestia filamentosa TaxID=1402861 RepID=A0A1X7D8K3_9BACI|nr:hypothetical protein [Priestia filamentosa]AKO93761.1 hypothetical protein BEH_17785 [Priestia filamentosa]MDT3763997.1 hypothetical protein [Priestia filamentosa]OXS71527.1 hypothetical protein B1B01_04195 [Priestia filamentosa]RJS67171.1 hypothetical protein CJ485_21555 [Priestia filamentosa]WCM14635.1 hypothetical protein PGN40_14930 [Priestia filamentosa]